ncbi:MAG: AAA family ATPase [Erysipelotrichaceae bacterium]|nr:AAA family ATPase [Erysipelotrichaceae bacterium]
MNNEMMDTINGIFVHTIYRSDNYMVARFETDDGVITVTGPAFEYTKGEKYSLSGNYTDHPRYGFQFNITSISRYIPSRKEDIIRFLSGSVFKGIGKKAAAKIYDAYGDECIMIIKDDPSALESIDLTKKQLESIREGLLSLEDADNETVLMLISSGFSNSEANRIFHYYKENTVFIYKDNPFRFYLDIYGIPFNKVLNCAINMEFEDKEIKFKEAYLIYLFKEISFNTGNTYLDREDFENAYLRDYADLDQILDLCIKDGEIVFEDGHYYYRQEYSNERYIAEHLNGKRESLDKDEVNVLEAISDNENLNGISYDEDQKKAIISFFREDISMIIGGPGSGKTTLIKAMVSIFRDFFPYSNIMVVAPTGRAAKRINEICDVESKTIHSLLKWNKDTNTFIHKEENPILYDCLIIDEFSMVDNDLFASLLKASQYVKKICLIGDSDQLPSIRQGDLLKDLTSSGRYTVTRLCHNHRQKEGNDIITLARQITDGHIELEDLSADVSFIDINSIDYRDLVGMVNSDIENGNGLDDIQVLSPMYRGEYGIDNLNMLLQSSFNPRSIDKKEKKVGKLTFRENDKILQLKNRPVDDVYNGDIGILEEIDEREKCLIVDYQGAKVFYENGDLNDISLAYALSVHKAQGSEYKIVYFIVSKQHQNMLYKQLLYTAVSRAKSKLVIIGDRDVFQKAVHREIGSRKSGLLKRLLNE